VGRPRHVRGQCLKWMKLVDWINVAQDRDRWRAVVNTVMNILVT
jgi:hypothetical protein